MDWGCPLVLLCRCSISSQPLPTESLNTRLDLSAVGPPQAVGGLGGSNSDDGRGAGDAVSPALAQKGP